MVVEPHQGNLGVRVGAACRSHRLLEPKPPTEVSHKVWQRSTLPASGDHTGAFAVSLRQGDLAIAEPRVAGDRSASESQSATIQAAVGSIVRYLRRTHLNAAGTRLRHPDYEHPAVTLSL